jgi:high-affinity Fe2+/Pb2+ permease
VTNGLLSLIAAGLFLLHWRWLRRLDDGFASPPHG